MVTTLKLDKQTSLTPFAYVSILLITIKLLEPMRHMNYKVQSDQNRKRWVTWDKGKHVDSYPRPRHQYQHQPLPCPMHVFTGDALLGEILIGTRRARCPPYSIVPNVLSVTGFRGGPPSSALR
jgi:hypothetical protein